MVTDIAVPNRWSDSCRQLLELGRLDAARELIGTHLDADPQDVEAAGLLGLWMAMAGRPADAEAHWRNLIETCSAAPLQLERLGHFLAELGREDLVAEIVRWLRETSPDSAIAEYFEGRSAQILGQATEATERWREALLRDPTCQLARLALTQQLEQLGAFDEALEHCEILIAQAGESPERLSHKGRLLLELGNAAQATPVLEKARAAGHSDLEPWLARSLRLQGDCEAALELLSKPHLTGSAAVAQERALALEALGRFDEAHRTAAEALVTTPDQPDLQWLSHRLARSEAPDQATPPAVLGGFMGRVHFQRRRERLRVACLPFSSLGQDRVNLALARGIAPVLARSLSSFCEAQAIPFYKDRAGAEPFNFDFLPGHPDLSKWGKAAGAQVLVSGESYLFDECVFRVRVTHLEKDREVTCREIRGPRAALVELVEAAYQACVAALEKLGLQPESESPAPFEIHVPPPAFLHYVLAAPPPAHSLKRCRALLAATEFSERFPWAERELLDEIAHLESEGRRELGLQILATFAAARPADTPIQRSLAEKALTAGNPSLALTAYERCRAADPDAAVPAFTVAQMLHAEGRLDEAIEAYREATRSGDQVAAAHGELAGLLARRERFDDALIHWRQAVKIDPSLVRYRLRIAELSLQRGDPESAREQIRELETCQPPPPGLEALRRRLPEERP